MKLLFIKAAETTGNSNPAILLIYQYIYMLSISDSDFLREYMYTNAYN